MMLRVCVEAVLLLLFPPDRAPLPLEIIKMVRCGCSSNWPCSSARSSSVIAQLACSIFCVCHKTENCSSEKNGVASVDEDEEQNQL